MKITQEEKKAITLIAEYFAYSNGAEFIRQHPECGGYFLNNKLQRAYEKATKKVFNELAKKSDLILKEFKKLEIEVNTMTNDDIEEKYF